MSAIVPDRPISRNSRSPVASNWRIADPNWKPCVHSVQPALAYRPFTVKTGDPSAGFQVSSILRILPAERSNKFRILVSKSDGFRSNRILSIFTGFAGETRHRHL